LVNVDRKFRLARHWSNKELRKIANIFKGAIVNVSGGDDIDKEGNCYVSYFTNASSYMITNWNPGSFRGFQDRPNEVLLDLTGSLPDDLHQRFDVAFNHTTLEHIFEVQTAFSNLCAISKDVVIVVVPFSQVQHENEGYMDYWRFTPTCMRKLFEDNKMTVIYESMNTDMNAAIYLFFVASRHPEKWQSLMPDYEPISCAGQGIGFVPETKWNVIKNKLAAGASIRRILNKFR